MKLAKLGQRFQYRDLLEPENCEEVIQVFNNEINEFIKWANTLSETVKESIFWETNYDEQLYLDVSIERLLNCFPNLEDLDKSIIDNLVYAIARNHEQGNILAWMHEKDDNISHVSMSLQQFKYLAKAIVQSNEMDAKFQVAAVYRKIETSKILQSDIELVKKLAQSDDEYTRRQSKFTLESWKYIIKKYL